MAWAAILAARGAVVGESVTVGAGSGLELNARYFRPAGEGPFPAVVVLHGSGGLWRDNDPAANVMSRHFEEWAQTFASEGYASLFVDSFTPRGIIEFPGRRPAEDPGEDDSLCSPAYERPKDVFKALAFLQARPEIQDDRIALLGFSHGAETALSSLVSASVTKNTWTMSYLKLNGETETRAFPAPARLPASPGFAVAVVYYPGCGYYGYWGSPSSTASNLYMPYAPTLIQHGSADTLYSGNLYPERFVDKSGSQAAAINLTFNPLQLAVYTNATHSFDEADLSGPVTANQTARQQAQALTLQWFAAYLKPPQLQASLQPDGRVQIIWPRGKGIRQRLLKSDGPVSPAEVVTETVSPTTGYEAFSVFPVGPRQFFRIENLNPAAL